MAVEFSMTMRFVEGFAKVTLTLNVMLLEDEDMHDFEDPKLGQVESFNEHEEVLVRPPMLALPTVG